MISNSDLLNKGGVFDLNYAIQKMVSLPAITLSAQEADTFIEWVWDQSTLKTFAKLERMSTATKNIRGLGWGSSRFLVPEAEFDSTKVTTTFSEELIQLTSKEFRGAILIKDSDLEDINIGSANQFKDHIMSMAAKKMAEELEEICWIGDTASLSGFAVDDARSMVDGWRYRLDNSQSGETYENSVTGSTTLLDASNTVTDRAADFTITTSNGIVETSASPPYPQEIKFDKMRLHLPSQYKMGGLGNLRYLCNDQVLDNYTTALQERGTTLGDMAVMGKNFTVCGGVPIMPVPLMPVTMEIYAAGQKENYDAANGDLTDAVLTVKDNFVLGIQLDIVLEAERSAADRGNYYYFTTRIDTAVADVAAAVLLKRAKIV